MYKTAARWMIRRNIEALNSGDAEPVLGMFAAAADLCFPGVNSWSGQFRQPVTGRQPFVSHRGRDEIEAFLRRYTGDGIQMEVEDILVNGPPWNTRVAVRAQVWATGPNGMNVYENRAVLLLTVRWGKVKRQEDYEDTERAAQFDAYHHRRVPRPSRSDDRPAATAAAR
jgi:ketosteroid isomerase-like protein